MGNRAKRKSFLFKCLKCGTEWHIGYNRIRTGKITSCPNKECNTMPTKEQVNLARFTIEV